MKLMAGGGVGNGPAGMKLGGGVGNGPAGMKLTTGGGVGNGPAGMKLGGGVGNGPAGMKLTTGGGVGNGPAGMKLGGGVGNGPAGMKLGGGVGNGPAGIAFAVQAVMTSSERTITLRTFNLLVLMEKLPWRRQSALQLCKERVPQSGYRIYDKSGIKNNFPPK